MNTESKQPPTDPRSRIRIIRHSDLGIRTSAPAFTLTEVLIALALISFLLVGISRIFAMMSATISTGQGVSTALRSHKAVGQAMSNDFIGYSSRGKIEKSDDNSGMAPLVIAEGSTGGAPFLSISNFRRPTYASEKDYRTAYQPPALTSTAGLVARSAAIRTIEDSDGNLSTLSIYDYGVRNFRTDLITFFAKGKFRSQTGGNLGSPQYQFAVQSDDSMVWYGQLRVFNSQASLVNVENGYGQPGDFVNTLNNQNINNRFADQFILGRFQALLVEPYNHDGTGAEDYFRNTVTATDDSTQRVYFWRRNWTNPTDLPLPPATGRPTITPLNLNSRIYCYNPSSGQNDQIDTDDSDGNPFNSGNYFSVSDGRSDIAGVGLNQMRDRVRFCSEYDLTNSIPKSDNNAWWRYGPTQFDSPPVVPTGSSGRFYGNPYVTNDTDKGLSVRGLSQMQQILAQSCSQFIVEYAGDFITQNPTTGVPGPSVPDGIIDFAVIEDPATNVKYQQTRWYGMPRDVDGKNGIPGRGPLLYESPDVVPLRDLFGGVGASFEKVIPANVANYETVTTEPAANSTDSGYICVWGTQEFEEAALAANRRRVPHLIRIIVELRDQKGRLSEPVTQEYVFPVKVSE